MSSQTANLKLVGEKLLIEYSRRLVRQLSLIARQIYAELKRLNRGGHYSKISPSGSRHHRTQSFKAVLAQKYSDHNRCC
jgi:hypothetical protein